MLNLNPSDRPINIAFCNNKLCIENTNGIAFLTLSKAARKPSPRNFMIKQRCSVPRRPVCSKNSRSMVATTRSPSWAVRRVVPAISQKTSARAFLSGAGASIFLTLNRRATSADAGECFEQSLWIDDGQRTHRSLAYIGGRFSVDEPFAGSRMVARERAPRGDGDEHAVRQGCVVDGASQGFERRFAAFPDENDLQGLCQQLDIVEHSGEREKVAAHLAGERLEDRQGAVLIGFLTSQYCEPGQHTDQSPVASGNRGIGSGLGASDQTFGIICGKEITAIGRIPIMLV